MIAKVKITGLPDRISLWRSAEEGRPVVFGIGTMVSVILSGFQIENGAVKITGELVRIMSRESLPKEISEGHRFTGMLNFIENNDCFGFLEFEVKQTQQSFTPTVPKKKRNRKHRRSGKHYYFVAIAA